MKYENRLTSRSLINGEYIYFSTKNDSEIYRRLGLYEDLMLTPYEIADILITYEMQKPKEKWNMDKLERWVQIKMHFD